MTKQSASYDAFAWFYDKYWSERVPVKILQAIDRIDSPSLSSLPAGSHILDLCCGSGQVAARLAARGFQVTGIDESKEMLRYARRNAPKCRFVCARAESFKLSESFAAVVSTFDSLNHVLSLRELQRVFQNVYSALDSGGLFVFDLNMETGFRARWSEDFSIVRADAACIMRGRYDAQLRLAHYDATVLRRMKTNYTRHNFTLIEKCYRKSEVRKALSDAGLRRIRVYDAVKDLDLAGHTGRAFFQAQKS